MQEGMKKGVSPIPANTPLGGGAVYLSSERNINHTVYVEGTNAELPGLIDRPGNIHLRDIARLEASHVPNPF
jgi:hypothetical protein